MILWSGSGTAHLGKISGEKTHEKQKASCDESLEILERLMIPMVRLRYCSTLGQNLWRKNHETQNPPATKSEILGRINDTMSGSGTAHSWQNLWRKIRKKRKNLRDEVLKF